MPERHDGRRGPEPGASTAHLHFECIHPFADGNGRIGRAISEIALSQDLGRPALLSLSMVIEAKRKRYYEALATASRDLADLLQAGALRRLPGGGRSTRYELALGDG